MGRMHWASALTTSGRGGVMGVAHLVMLGALAIILGCSAPAPAPAAPPPAKAPQTAGPATGSPGAAPTTSSTAASVKRGGSITIACSDNGIAQLDPALEPAPGECPGLVYRAVYNTLVQVGKGGEILPEVAQSWTISPDQTEYRFTLRNDVIFHDGSKLDSAAVRYSVERMLDIKAISSGATALRETVKAVANPDPATVLLTLKAPDSSLLLTISQVFNLPIVNRAVVEKNGNLAAVAAGSGPFDLARFTRGGDAELARFDRYWELGADGKPLPYLDRFRVAPIIDPAVRFLNLQSGDVDLTLALDVKNVADVRADSNLQYVDNLVGELQIILGINPNVAPFTNKAVRQAVVEAIDRQAILDAASFKTGRLRPGPFAEHSPWDIVQPDWSFNVQSAQSKLTAAGVKDVTVPLSTVARQPDQQMIAAIQQQLAKVGITVTPNPVDRATWLNINGTQKNSALFITRITTFQDANQLFTYFLGNQRSNWAGWNDAQSDEILRLGQESLRTTDTAQRKALYQKVVDIWVDASVYVPIGNFPLPNAARKYVQGVEQVDRTLRLERVWRSS